MHFLWQRNLIHRDIKPQNLLLVTDARRAEDVKAAAASSPSPSPYDAIPFEYRSVRIMLADFGFARELNQDSMAETLCGSPLYMAPEILAYENYDAKADLWSIGAIFFESCTGHTPWTGGNYIELLRECRD